MKQYETKKQSMCKTPGDNEVNHYTNVPADPSLWDDNFTATSLLGTNKFLNSDIYNMAYSLQQMACFLRQRNLEDCNGNNILQLKLFSESAWSFISAIFESDWDQLVSSNNASIRDNITLKFGKVNFPNRMQKEPLNVTMVKKVLPPIPPCPLKKVLEKSKMHQCILTSKGKDMLSPLLSYAQATYQALNILKIKKAFPVLLDKKILEIHNMAFPKPINREKKIQPTIKGPFRKQAIIPVSTKLTKVIMGEANSHIFQINTLLKNIKSNLRAEFICLFPGSLSINTNNVPNPSNLLTMEKYLKSIASANNKEVLASRLL